MKATLTRTLKAWYGISMTLRLYGTRWASVGPFPPHPQLVNMVLRIGLSKDDSVHLQVLHELGHLQSLPLIIPISAIPFVLSWPLLPSIAGLVLLWEIMSESYVILREGRNY
ncbi:MAG: hypothetical protein PVJ01_06540, partial [Pseudomonadota bacterium]